MKPVIEGVGRNFEMKEKKKDWRKRRTEKYKKSFK